MLSFERGRPIAIIKDGKYNNKIIHLYDPNEKCCSKCSDKCINRRRKCCEDCKGGKCGAGLMDADIKNDPLDTLREEDIRKHKKKLSKEEMSKIRYALKNYEEPDDELLSKIYNLSMKQVSDQSKKEFLLHDDGVINPLPHFKQTERTFIAGPTGSGKSYYTKKYLTQLRKVFPDKKIFIFSDVDEDPELDDIPGIIRVKLDKNMIDKPIRPAKLADSIVVFDDIDSIQDKEISNSVMKLRDSLLRRGRHEDISVIVTSHLMSNYKDTRIILNEANSITFFPRSGATDAIKYTLKKYCNMNSKEIEKCLKLPSRWVTVYKNYPNYILYEKGVYLL